MEEKYFDLLYKMSLKAFGQGEVPVSAIIVKNGKILAKSYNKRKKTANPLLHAEVQCIIKTAKKTKDWRLSDCDMYVTLKPCHMCQEIIKESRIKNVYYILDNEKNINFKSNLIKLNEEKYINKYKELLTSFFGKLR